MATPGPTPPPPPPPPPGPTGAPASIQQQVLKDIQDKLLNRNQIFQVATKEITAKLSALGINVLGGVVDLGKAIMDEGLRQAQDYEDNIVNVFGDISTQQETFGKSLGKLTFERTQEFRQQFMQMEEGGVRMMDVFEDAEKAASHAQDIMNELPGSAAQFTEDLQGQNLSVIQLLSKASGLASEQTAAIMKISKGRKEDSKQMLADIGTFSKTLADKFSLDMKEVSRATVEITQNASTFGKVSVEAAAAAAAKFESLGVTVEDVAGSIGSTFGSFSGAADAAAKLSQVFGVNIDAMQMMVDVNSGPEGMLSAMDNLRESLIGAGVDASELSAPLRRLIKEMTGVRDDATIESLFDPDRMSADTEDILDAAKKAADAQKEPADAIKFLDRDIAKVHRSVEQLDSLISRQQLARLGTQSIEAAKGFSQLSSSSGKFFDSANLFLERSEKIGFGKALDTTLKTASAGADVGKAAVEGADKIIKETAKQEGVSLTTAKSVDYTQMQQPGRGVWQDEAYQAITGYVPPKAALENAAAKKALEETRDFGLEAMASKQKTGSVDPVIAQKFNESFQKTVDAYKAIGVDLGPLLGGSTGSAGGGTTPMPTGGIGAVLSGGTYGPAATSPSATSTVTPASPVSATPAVPVSTAPAGAAAPAAGTGPAPTGGGAAGSGPVSMRAGTTTVPVGAATANVAPNAPSHINLSVTLDVGPFAKALASHGGLAIVGSPSAPA